MIPLSRASGLLQWCNGTIPLSEYLVEEKGAHRRIRNQDIADNTARMQMHVGINIVMKCIMISLLYYKTIASFISEGL